jgi:hypothetical protein
VTERQGGARRAAVSRLRFGRRVIDRLRHRERLTVNVSALAGGQRDGPAEQQRAALVDALEAASELETVSTGYQVNRAAGSGRASTRTPS